MKKSEVRVGAEYALGSTSRYDRLRGVKGGVSVSLDAFAWLVRKLDPVGAVDEVLAELHRDPRPRDEDDYLDRVDVAKGRMRRRLAMSREEERAAGKAFDEALV